jgi:GAF domain-containing protein/two-component sensor histidine kinase
VNGEASRVLVDEQAALRRVATLVARGVPADEVFAAVTEEAGRLLSVQYAHLGRFESGGTVTILAASGRSADRFPVGRRWRLRGKNPSTLVFETGRPARIDSSADASGPLGLAAREDGIGSSVGTPIIVEGRLWGVLAAGSILGQPLPADTETRLASFTELVATAIANADSRAELARLAEDQAALRRVATLVARGTSPEEVFAAVTEEVGRRLGTHLAGMARYDGDDTTTVLAAWAADGEHPLVPGQWPLEDGDLASTIWRTGRPVRIDNFDGIPGRLAASVREKIGIGSTVGSPIVVDGSLWGALIVHSKQTHQPLSRDTESRLTGFTELVAAAIASTESRAKLARLAEEQAALRRVATLVARGAPPEELFAAVTEEAGRLLSVEYAALSRYEPDRGVTVVAVWGRTGHHVSLGNRLIVGGNNVGTLVFETGRPARIDNYADASGPLADVARGEGVGAAAGTPIIVEGRLWGVMATYSAPGQPLPADTEARLANFTDLLATAIANAESSAGLSRLAEEQAALRRVATLVARGVPPAELFAAVTEEVGRLLATEYASLGRYESDGTLTTVATSSQLSDRFPVGRRWTLGGKNINTLVFTTGRPARIDDYADASGPLGDTGREHGVGSGVGTPVIVEGRLWGVIIARSRPEQVLSADTEARLASFTELVATAIANAESRAELMASRARVVAAADETRRRIERDLHDGIQQRLVSLGLETRAAQAGAPLQLEEFEGVLSRVSDGLASVFDELQEISRGIHPAILSQGGLKPALKGLCRRSPVPVELDLHTERRLPEPVEVAAYYVVSEALTNAAKHAHASVVNVELDTHDATLRLTIRDNGIGGANLSQGSGLVGLSDRIEALGGTLQVSSPAGNGTTLRIEVPLEDQSSAISPEP